ncbi:MAG: gamma-glutamyl-gamma-aminobutyrate hydrolase family protein [Tissierellia bacterium]|nr:gamma-glutamyl-gamma-aminobutyrate hydrolase family protein [Tissierellia bacterium]
MSKPIIGLSGSVLTHKGRSFSGYLRSYANEDYVNAVIKNGGIPFILPVTEDEEIVKSQIDHLDGLIITGGHDISPSCYNEEPMQRLQETLPARDKFDLYLFKYAIEKNIPIFGICRGFQMMNVYFGGSLYQDLSYNKDYYIQHDQKDGATIKIHSIDVDEDSFLYQAVGEKNIRVNSFHHQVLKDIPDDLRVVARAKDGVAEAIQHKTYDYMVGVQFHPEMLFEVDSRMNKLFEQFIEKSKG